MSLTTEGFQHCVNFTGSCSVEKLLISKCSIHCVFYFVGEEEEGRKAALGLVPQQFSFALALSVGERVVASRAFIHTLP